MATPKDFTPASRASSESTTRILAAAENLFATHGFDAVSMNQIAAAADVSKANIFHHFTSKKDLYLAVLRHACHDSTEHIQRLFAATAPLPQRLADFTMKQINSMFEHSQVTRLILRELHKDGERQGRDLAEKVFGDDFARLVEILGTGQTRHELRRDLDPAMIAILLIGANVFFFVSQEIVRHFPDVKFAGDRERYSRMLVDILLRGIVDPQQQLTDSPDTSSAARK